MHANFAEYAPFAIGAYILLALAGVSAWFIHALGSVFLIGRVAHAAGLGQHEGASVGRVIGVAATMLVLIAASLRLLGRCARMTRGVPSPAATGLRPGLQHLLRAAALEAGALAMRWFRPGERTPARVWTKGKGSPVTEADVEVDTLLRRRLAVAGDEFGWLSEETVDSPERLERRLVFIVDPIDGTRAFIEGDPRWCVSLALVADGAPIAAMVHAPALDFTHEATCDGPALLNGAADRRLACVLPRAGARRGATFPSRCAHERRNADRGDREDPVAGPSLVQGRRRLARRGARFGGFQ